MTIRMYRLFEEENKQRSATAKLLSDGSVFQVFPEKKAFPTVDAWKATWPNCKALKEEIIQVTPRIKKPSTLVLRRNKELMEFFDPEYMNIMNNLKIYSTPEPIVRIEMPDDSYWEIARSLDFLEAPRVWKNGVRFGQQYEAESYSPALTSVHWWMMLCFNTL